MTVEASPYQLAAPATCWGSFASSPVQGGLARLPQNDQQWYAVSPSKIMPLSGWSVQELLAFEEGTDQEQLQGSRAFKSGGPSSEQEGTYNPYHHCHSGSSPAQKELSHSSGDLSMEEEELALTLVKLQEGPNAQTTPAGRPKRSKRKRFDSDDYVFEDVLMANQEVGAGLYTPAANGLTDALISVAASSSAGPERTSEGSMHKRARKALTFSPTLSMTSDLTQPQKRKGSGRPSPVRTEVMPLQLFPEPKLCHGCGTSTTPLWRNGPAGPKTLCNACGTQAYRHVKKASWCTGNHIATVPPIAPASLAAAAV